MTDKIVKILNEQINEEFYSAYLYLSFSAKLEKLGFRGAANWMNIQAREENDHALGIFKFMLDRGEEPKLKAVAEPKEINTLNDITAIFKASLNHELYITGLINKISELAREEKDYALESFIKWYTDEQIEEEANAMENVDKLNLIGENGSALYIFDQELKTRIYIPSGPYAAGKAA